MMSFALGLTFACGVIAQTSVLKLVVIALGALVTFSGSGLTIMALSLVLSLVTRSGSKRSVGIFITLGLMAVFLVLSPLGYLILERTSEFQDPRSSTSLRSLQPYSVLTAELLRDAWTLLFGFGPGASQRAVIDTGVNGLMVPTPLKVIFDFGVIGGALFTLLFLLPFAQSKSNTLAFAVAAPYFLLQGTAAPMVVMLTSIIAVWPRGDTEAAFFDGVLRPTEDQIERMSY